MTTSSGWDYPPPPAHDPARPPQDHTGVVAGLVISAMALSRSRRGLAGGRGLAIAGLVLGILGLVLTVLVVVAFASFVSASGP